jgi:CYTH domain-containing protein
MKEIERKFLVNTSIDEVLKRSRFQEIKQGYMHADPEKTIRVRTKGSKGYLTIKGKTIGITRSEFEYEIPYPEALRLLELFCPKTLTKKRYEIVYEGNTWEIDVFEGNLTGLIVAEIELSSEDQRFSKPEWIGEEVSHDPSYINSNLIERA